MIHRSEVVLTYDTYPPKKNSCNFNLNCLLIYLLTYCCHIFHHKNTNILKTNNTQKCIFVSGDLLGNTVKSVRACLWFCIVFLLFTLRQYTTTTLRVYADQVWQAFYFAHVQSSHTVYLLSFWLVFLILLSNVAGHWVEWRISKRKYNGFCMVGVYT